MSFDRRALNNALRTFLQDETGKNFGLVKPPTDVTTPYGIIFPITSPSATGSWKQPEEDREWTYQITSVGSTTDESSELADVVAEILVKRGYAGGGFETAWSPAGISIINRRSGGRGGTVASGEHLFQTDDLYWIKTGA